MRDKSLPNKQILILFRSNARLKCSVCVAVWACFRRVNNEYLGFWWYFLTCATILWYHTVVESRAVKDSAQVGHFLSSASAPSAAFRGDSHLFHLIKANETAWSKAFLLVIWFCKNGEDITKHCLKGTLDPRVACFPMTGLGSDKKGRGE